MNPRLEKKREELAHIYANEHTDIHSGRSSFFDKKEASFYGHLEGFFARDALQAEEDKKKDELMKEMAAALECAEEVLDIENLQCLQVMVALEKYREFMK